MSIKIHHGPNGAYKTSGAIQDDAIPAIREGRTIITNIRGFTRESVFAEMPDTPPELEVLNLSMESTDDLEKMRRWFMWAPRGAFLIFDETQILFPKSWRDKDLEQFDFPGGIEEAKQADRPVGWLDAWTRHRHWNWDVVLTTPNIRYIRDDIRLTCEKAYLHANLAVIGVPGRYKEAMHDAQENKPPMDGSSIVTIKRIKPSTFRLYQSTATGKVQDTKAGKNLFLSPKVLGLLVFIALLLAFAFRNGTPHVLSSQLPASATPSAAQGAAPAPRVGAVPMAGSKGPIVPAPVVHPLSTFTMRVRAVLQGLRDGRPRQIVMVELAYPDGAKFVQNGDDLQRLGYRVKVYTPCVIELIYQSWRQKVFCAGQLRDVDKKALDAPAPVAVATPPRPVPPAQNSFVGVPGRG